MPALLTLVLAITFALSASASQRALTIGLVGVSPDLSLYLDKQIYRGAQEAIRDINSRNNYKFDIFYMGDQCNPQLAGNISEKMKTKNVHFVIGHPCAKSAIEASSNYESNKILYVSLGVRHPALTMAKRKYTFRLSTRADEEGKWAARLFASRSEVRNIAIAFSDDPLGNSMKNAFSTEWRRQDRKIIALNRLDKIPRNYSNIIMQIKASEATAVYVAHSSSKAIATFTRQLVKQSAQSIVVSNHIDNAPLLEKLPRKGQLYVSSPVSPSMYAEARDVVRALSEKGSKPSNFTLNAYVAVQLIAKSVASTGSLDPTKNSEWLKTNSVQSIIGNIDFNDKGDVIGTPVALYVLKGKEISNCPGLILSSTRT